MTSTAVTASPSRDLIRDPVLLLPLVVAAGLSVGWLGVDKQVAGTRIAADLVLSWALVAAALVVLERPRWRQARWLLAATAFALLGADLEWASSHALWTLGFVLEGLWVALFVQLVLTFPEGRSWSRVARVAIVAAYAMTFGGQLVGAFVVPDARDALSVAPYASVAHTVDRVQEISSVGLALVVLFLALQRARGVRGPARRLQGPLLLAAVITALAALVWLGWVITSGTQVSTLETIARAVAVTIPLGIVTGVGWSRLRRPQASELVVELRTKAAATMRERLARALGDPTLEVAYRLGDGRYVDAAGRPIELSQRADRAVTAVTAGGEEIAALVHDPALLDEPALVESVRATAGLVLENERLAAEVRSERRRRRRRNHNGRFGARRAARPARGARRDPVDQKRSAPRDDRLGRVPVRVVIADDAPLIREGVARLLTENAIEVVDQVGDADALLRSVRDLRPDVALVDIRMPPTHTDEGLRAAREIRSRNPGTAVLVLSQHLEPDYALQLVEERPEGVGYLMKERVGRVDQLLDAVQRVAAGECVVDRSVVDDLLARRRRVDPIEELTSREREILALMAEGRSNQGICRALWLSPKTVETHIRSAFAKLGIPAAPQDNRRVLAVLAYLRR